MIDNVTAQAMIIASACVPILIYLLRNIWNLDQKHSTGIIFGASLLITVAAIYQANGAINLKDLNTFIIALVVSNSISQLLQTQLWPTRLSRIARLQREKDEVTYNMIPLKDVPKEK